MEYTYSLPATHCSQLLEYLNEQRKYGNENLCDVRFTVGSDCVYAHRCVLAVCSAYFQGLLSGAFLESQGDGGTSSKMMDMDFTGSVSNIAHLDTLLTAVYTGSLKLSTQNITGVTELSCFLLVEPVRLVCESFLQENLSMHTCVHYLKLAWHYDLQPLFKECRQLLQGRFHDHFIYQPLMLTVPAQCLKLLTKMLCYVGMQDVVQFLSQWVEGQGESGDLSNSRDERLSTACKILHSHTLQAAKSDVESDADFTHDPFNKVVAGELSGQEDVVSALLEQCDRFVENPVHQPSNQRSPTTLSYSPATSNNSDCHFDSFASSTSRNSDNQHSDKDDEGDSYVMKYCLSCDKLRGSSRVGGGYSRGGERFGKGDRFKIKGGKNRDPVKSCIAGGENSAEWSKTEQNEEFDGVEKNKSGDGVKTTISGDANSEDNVKSTITGVGNSAEWSRREQNDFDDERRKSKDCVKTAVTSVTNSTDSIKSKITFNCNFNSTSSRNRSSVESCTNYGDSNEVDSFGRTKRCFGSSDSVVVDANIPSTSSSNQTINNIDGSDYGTGTKRKKDNTNVNSDGLDCGTRTRCVEDGCSVKKVGSDYGTENERGAVSGDSCGSEEKSRTETNSTGCDSVNNVMNETKVEGSGESEVFDNHDSQHQKSSAVCHDSHDNCAGINKRKHQSRDDEDESKPKKKSPSACLEKTSRCLARLRPMLAGDDVNRTQDVLVAFVPGKSVVSYFTATDCARNRPSFIALQLHVCLYHIPGRRWLHLGEVVFPGKLEEKDNWRVACVNCKAYFFSLTRQTLYVLDLHKLTFETQDCRPIFRNLTHDVKIKSLVPFAVKGRLYVLVSDKRKVEPNDRSEDILTSQRYFRLEENNSWQPIADVEHKHSNTPLTILTVSDSKAYVVKATLAVNLEKSLYIVREGHILNPATGEVKLFRARVYAVSPMRVLIRNETIHIVNGDNTHLQLGQLWQEQDLEWKENGVVDLSDIKIVRGACGESFLPCVTHASANMGASNWEFASFQHQELQRHSTTLTELRVADSGNAFTVRHPPPPFRYVTVMTACQLSEELVASAAPCRYLHVDNVNM